MLRYALFCGLALSLIIGCGAFAEAMPPAFPSPCPPRQACAPSPPPITRTVHVDVPAPCPPPPCGYRNPCGPPTCAPPPPTRPVRVRVDVVVRPEAEKQCLPKRYCCENPPIFEPIFCRAAEMLRSLIVAPLGLGERFLGHGFPRPPCPPPTPIACPPHGRRVQPCVGPCPPRTPLIKCSAPQAYAPKPIKCTPRIPGAPMGYGPFPR